MKHPLFSILGWLVLSPLASAAEPSGSLYVLTLQHARNQVNMVGIPLQVWMECEGTIIRRTLALATQGTPEPLTVDVSQLQVSPDRVAGTISAKWPDIGKHTKAADRTYTLDLALRDGRGCGAYAGGDGKKGAPPCELADVRRMEWAGLPATVHWEVVLANGRDPADGVKRDGVVAPVVALRFNTRDGKSDAAWAYACDIWANAGAVQWEHPLAKAVSEAQIGFRDGVLSGKVKLSAFTAGRPGYEIDLSAQVVGLRLGGAATIKQAGKEWNSPVVGIASGAVESNQFRPPQQETWAWSYSAKPNPDLVVQAVRQASKPPSPGRRGL